MSRKDPTSSSRRDFLRGRAFRAAQGEQPEPVIETHDEGLPHNVPSGGATLRFSTRAMACDFAIHLDPGQEDLWRYSDALDLVHPLEAQMTVYRDNSELAEINRRAASEWVMVEPQLFGLLRQAVRIAEETEGAFDPTSGRLVALWRECKLQGRVPEEYEIAAALENCGYQAIEFDEESSSIRYRKPGLELNLGGIGKGYALDRIAEELHANGSQHWLMHGGHSSIMASGEHGENAGWPVGIRHPLFPERHLASLLLQNQALSASGSGVQYFRYRGKRYGHILDPRTGWPVEGMLSVTVVAPTAAEADALSTAFFVLGLENALKYCDNRPEIGALLIPHPQQGRRLQPIVRGLSENVLFFHSDHPSTQD